MANCCLYYSALVLLWVGTWATVLDRPAGPSAGASVAGVFMTPGDGHYIYNATAASRACVLLAATLATQEQMEAAQRRGLQTCKFGWMEGLIAVIPRNTPDANCGKNKVGLATWRTEATKRFAAFCFKAEDVHTSTMATVPATFKPTIKATKRSHVRTTAAPPHRVPGHTTRAPPSTKAPWKPRPSPPPTPRFPDLPLKPTRRSSWSSSAPPSLVTSSSTSSTSSTSSGFTPMTPPTSDRKSKSSPATPVWATSLSSVPLHPTSSSTTTITSSFTTTTTTSSTTSSTPTENVVLQHSSKASMGALSVALIVLAFIVLVLSVAAGVSWYCKTPSRRLLPPWAGRGGPQQAGGAGDEGETEMWKHTDSNAELHSPLAAEDNADGKNASEITLCINSETKTPPTTTTTTATATTAGGAEE